MSYQRICEAVGFDHDSFLGFVFAPFLAIFITFMTFAACAGALTVMGVVSP